MATTFSQFLSAIAPEQIHLSDELKQLIENAAEDMSEGGKTFVGGIFIAVSKSGKAALISVPCRPGVEASFKKYVGLEPTEYTDSNGTKRYGACFQVGLSPRGRITWVKEGWPPLEAQAAPADTTNTVVDAADVDL